MDANTLAAKRRTNVIVCLLAMAHWFAGVWFMALFGIDPVSLGVTFIIYCLVLWWIPVGYLAHLMVVTTLTSWRRYLLLPVWYLIVFTCLFAVFDAIIYLTHGSGLRDVLFGD